MKWKEGTWRTTLAIREDEKDRLYEIETRQSFVLPCFVLPCFVPPFLSEAKTGTRTPTKTRKQRTLW